MKKKRIKVLAIAIFIISIIHTVASAEDIWEELSKDPASVQEMIDTEKKSFEDAGLLDEIEEKADEMGMAVDDLLMYYSYVYVTKGAEQAAEEFATILGYQTEDSTTASSMIATENGEWNYTKLAALSCLLVRSACKDPYSFELNEIQLGSSKPSINAGNTSGQSLFITYHAANDIGNKVIGYAMTYLGKEGRAFVEFGDNYLRHDDLPDGTELIMHSVTTESGILSVFTKERKLKNIDEIIEMMEAYLDEED